MNRDYALHKSQPLLGKIIQTNHQRDLEQIPQTFSEAKFAPGRIDVHTLEICPRLPCFGQLLSK
jgi:hypothetical protein